MTKNKTNENTDDKDNKWKIPKKLMKVIYKGIKLIATIWKIIDTLRRYA